MIAYTFKDEVHEEGKLISVKDRTIVKTGVEIEFSLNKMEENENLLEKQKKEVEGVIENRKAIISNIESFHPFVKELTEEQRNTVFMYREAEIDIKEYQPASDKINEMLEKSAIEKKEIIKQLELEIEPVEVTDIKDNA